MPAVSAQVVRRPDGSSPGIMIPGPPPAVRSARPARTNLRACRPNGWSRTGDRGSSNSSLRMATARSRSLSPAWSVASPATSSHVTLPESQPVLGEPGPDRVIESQRFTEPTRPPAGMSHRPHLAARLGDQSEGMVRTGDQIHQLLGHRNPGVDKAELRIETHAASQRLRCTRCRGACRTSCASPSAVARYGWRRPSASAESGRTCPEPTNQSTSSIRCPCCARS